MSHLPRSARARMTLVLLSVMCLLGSGMPASVAASTQDLERFALSLLNCTRTGGWVRENGTCRARGSGAYSGYRKPLTMHSGIRTNVARPYARRLAAANALTHSLHGTSIRGRLRTAGYRGTPYGESIARSGGVSVRQMIIRTHRMMQAEKSYNGWHWKNMKNRDFKRVGVGIAKSGSWSWVVYDFYGN